jgi:hypothetical protein
MQVSQLSDFFKTIKEDNRITTSHISLYVALFEFWNQNDFQNPVYITRRQVMEAAKINGIATFHKCIKDLNELRYIRYLPSRNPQVNSKVELLKL